MIFEKFIVLIKF